MHIDAYAYVYTCVCIAHTYVFKIKQWITKEKHTKPIYC